MSERRTEHRTARFLIERVIDGNVVESREFENPITIEYVDGPINVTFDKSIPIQADERLSCFPFNPDSEVHPCPALLHSMGKPPPPTTPTDS